MSTGDRRPPVLWALLFGNFVIGAGVMVVPATLTDISASLAVSPARAGTLISAAAVLMALGAPLLAAVVAGWDRRRLLALSMAWYAALHLLCALMPSFGALLPMRVLAVIAPAIFTPQAAACVSLLVPPEQRGRAITFVFLGWSVASVLGMPLGAYVGGTLGWRWAFGLIASLSVLSALWIWATMRDGVKPPALTLAAWRQTLGSGALMVAVAVTVLSSAGQFVLFAYLAHYYQAVLGASATQISILFLWFGAFGLLGNVMVSRYVDRIGAARVVFIALGAMALSLLLWPLGTSLILVALVSVPWALGCFSSNSAQQARLAGIAPSLAAGSIALNTSAMYAGQAIGAGSGGWLIAGGHLSSLHWASFVGLLLAMATSVLAARLRTNSRTSATIG